MNGERQGTGLLGLAAGRLEAMNFQGRKHGRRAKADSRTSMRVFSLVERGGGKVRSFHVPNVRAETL